MREYFIYAEVNYGEERWVTFEKKIQTIHSLVVGMEVLIPGMWVSKIALMQYDYASDEMSVHLECKEIPIFHYSGTSKLETSYEKEDCNKLIKNFADLGWGLYDGKWDSERLASEQRAETK